MPERTVANGSGWGIQLLRCESVWSLHRLCIACERGVILRGILAAVRVVEDYEQNPSQGTGPSNGDVDGNEGMQSGSRQHDGEREIMAVGTRLGC